MKSLRTNYRYWNFTLRENSHRETITTFQDFPSRGRKKNDDMPTQGEFEKFHQNPTPSHTIQIQHLTTTKQ